MAIQPTEGRNIVNYARKIVAEKLIMERRQWELMAANKIFQDVAEMGAMHLSGYRGLMIGITAVDLLDVNSGTLSTNLVNQTEFQMGIINTLARYLLLELTRDEIDELASHLSYSIICWTFGANGSSDVPEAEDGKDPFEEEGKVIVNILSANIPYITMMLLSDLHHFTYVASADQCLEILSST